MSISNGTTNTEGKTMRNIYFMLYIMGKARDAASRFLDRYGDTLAAISFGISFVMICAGWGD